MLHIGLCRLHTACSSGCSASHVVDTFLFPLLSAVCSYRLEHMVWITKGRIYQNPLHFSTARAFMQIVYRAYLFSVGWKAVVMGRLFAHHAWFVGIPHPHALSYQIRVIPCCIPSPPCPPAPQRGGRGIAIGQCHAQKEATLQTRTRYPESSIRGCAAGWWLWWWAQLPGSPAAGRAAATASYHQW